MVTNFPPRWEYKVDHSARTPETLEGRLNELAAEGWRIVAIEFPVPTLGGFSNKLDGPMIVAERPFTDAESAGPSMQAALRHQAPLLPPFGSLD